MFKTLIVPLSDMDPFVLYWGVQSGRREALLSWGLLKIGWQLDWCVVLLTSKARERLDGHVLRLMYAKMIGISDRQKTAMFLEGDRVAKWTGSTAAFVITWIPFFRCLSSLIVWEQRIGEYRPKDALIVGQRRLSERGLLSFGGV